MTPSVTIDQKVRAMQWSGHFQHRDLSDILVVLARESRIHHASDMEARMGVDTGRAVGRPDGQGLW